MAFHTYILRSLSTGRFYVGRTSHLPKRDFGDGTVSTVVKPSHTYTLPEHSQYN